MSIWKWSIKAEVDIASVKKETAKLKKELKSSWDSIEKNMWAKARRTIWALENKMEKLNLELKKTEIWSKSFKKLQKEIKKTNIALNSAKNGTTGFMWKLWGLKWILTWGFIVAWAMALWTFWKKLLTIWSDAQEIWSKFDTVFSGIEEKTRNTFTSMADAMWRSALDLQMYGAELWDVLKPLWFLTQEAADLSTEMVQLAVDVASFNNVSDTQVIDSFRSALTGERESLKTLGIVISEADVKQEALNMWLIKQGQNLTKQQKALATYSLLLKNTTDAQWDAIRTSKSFANQVKRLGWVIKDVFAEAGKDIAGDTGNALQKVSNFIKVYGVATVKAFIEILKSIWWAFMPIVDFFAESFWTIWELLWQWKADTFSWGDFFIKVLTWINAWFKTIGFAIKSIIIIAKTQMKLWANLWIWWFRIITSAFSLVGTSIWDTMKWVPKLMESWIKKWINLVVWKLNEFIAWINSTIGTSFDTIDLHFGDIDTDWLFDNTKAEFANLKNEVNTLGSAIWDNVDDMMGELWGAFTDFADDMVESNLKITDSVKTTAEVEDADAKARKKRIDEMKKNYSGVWDSAEKSWNKQAEASEEVKEKLEKLQEEYKATEKSIEELDKLTETYAKNSKKYTDDIISNIENLNKELIAKKKELEEEINDLETGKANDLADRYVEIKKREAEILQEINEIKKEASSNEEQRKKDLDDLNKQIEIQKQKLSEVTEKTKESTKMSLENKLEELEKQKENLENGDLTLEQLEKKNELEKENNQILSEKALIQENVNQAQLDNAERFSNLSESEQIIETAEIKKKKAQEEFDAEKEKIEWMIRINEFFNNVKELDEKSLNALLKNEKFKNMTEEEQALIIKLAKEKIELTNQKDAIISMQREISNTTINLQNRTLENWLASNDKLAKSYENIIAKLNSAISKQRKLNNMKWWWYKDGWYTWYARWWFTGSWNKDDIAWVVHKWEWVAPKWMVENLKPLFNNLEEKRLGWNTTNISKTQNNTINVWGNFEAENFLDYAKWKL